MINITDIKALREFIDKNWASFVEKVGEKEAFSMYEKIVWEINHSTAA